MSRTPEMQKFVDSLAKELFGHDGNPEHCVTCGGDAKEFRNKASEREHAISGMCQKCQDAIFGVD
jgi:hypothetical protein